MSAGICLTLSVPPHGVAAFEDALAILGGAVVRDDMAERPQAPVTLSVYLSQAPDDSRLQELLQRTALSVNCPVPGFHLEALPDTDWVTLSQEALPPIRAGRFYLYGAHNESPIPTGLIPLQVEANAAFGTGRHETTMGCLLTLCDLARKERPRRILDMGCGSGVLAMAAARLWPCRVLAVDNDPVAVRVARENAGLNGLARSVTCAVSDGYRSGRVRQDGPFDVIIANILAQPLCHMAKDLARHLAPGGVAILSGLLASQERQVFYRHRALGLRLSRRYPLGEWTTLVLRKKEVKSRGPGETPDRYPAGGG